MKRGQLHYCALLHTRIEQLSSLSLDYGHEGPTALLCTLTYKNRADDNFSHWDGSVGWGAIM